MAFESWSKYIVLVLLPVISITVDKTEVNQLFSLFLFSIVVDEKRDKQTVFLHLRYH